jgi:hypothetical protein
VKIAITAYVDNHHLTKFVDECNLMTFSGQLLDSRFTFVLFAHSEAVPLLDTYPNVQIIEYEVPKDKYYTDYKFARSLVFSYDKVDFFADYDYVIKTDTDVILTPNLNNFSFDEKIYVGLGHYSVNQESITALKQAAIDFGYPQYSRIADMHSTIIAKTSTMMDVMKLSDELCRKMYYELPEDGEWGTAKLWRGPLGGNSGVCSMYAAEIILSSVYPKEQVVVTDSIDAGSDWEKPWSEVYHYHCYHHDFIYSKFQSRYGSYRDLDYALGDSSAEYCLNVYIARREAAKKNPELFNKPEPTVDPLPPGYNGIPQIQYQYGSALPFKKV